MFRYIRFLLRLTRAHNITRRYFVTNGFDGALTTLGLVIGFYSTQPVAISIVISACMGAAIALAVSGFSSAYVSEAAEREKELKELEKSLVDDLGGTQQEKAARLVPVLIASVNGLAPLSMALIIMTPLFLTQAGIALPISALQSSIVMAFVTLFFLGAFLGKISGQFWLWSSLRTLVIALLTAAIILWMEH
jgi:predicted membrane protein (TIGR00267 family)